MDTAVLGTLSLALGIGLLIGLQRERAGSAIGGIRTFPLFALLGAVCGLLAMEWGGVIVVAGLIGVVTICVLANLAKRGSEEGETGGQTSEAAALLTFALGAYLATGHYAAAIVVGGVTAVLLQFKEPMHQFAGRMTRDHAVDLATRRSRARRPHDDVARHHGRDTRQSRLQGRHVAGARLDDVVRALALAFGVSIAGGALILWAWPLLFGR